MLYLGVNRTHNSLNPFAMFPCPAAVGLDKPHCKAHRRLFYWRLNVLGGCVVYSGNW